MPGQQFLAEMKNPGGKNQASTTSPKVFQFMITQPSGKLSLSDKRKVCSHAGRGRGRPKLSAARRKPCLGSWIKFHDDHETTGPFPTVESDSDLTKDGVVTLIDQVASPTPTPALDGSLSAVTGLAPHVLAEIVKCEATNTHPSRAVVFTRGVTNKCTSFFPPL